MSWSVAIASLSMRLTPTTSAERKAERHPEVPFCWILSDVLAVADVHGDFETETHFSSLGLGPHNVLLDCLVD